MRIGHRHLPPPEPAGAASPAQANGANPTRRGSSESYSSVAAARIRRSARRRLRLRRLAATICGVQAGMAGMSWTAAEMGESFDPYRRWLGIPSGDRPPNHYVLLGLTLYEDDADAIANAADRQMAYVRTHQIGPHVTATQQLLNELAAARLCLLNPAQKARYDADLKAKHAPVAAPVPVPVLPPAPPNEPQLAAGNMPRSAPQIAVSATALRSSAPRSPKK